MSGTQIPSLAERDVFDVRGLAGRDDCLPPATVHAGTLTMARYTEPLEGSVRTRLWDHEECRPSARCEPDASQPGRRDLPEDDHGTAPGRSFSPPEGKRSVTPATGGRLRAQAS